MENRNIEAQDWIITEKNYINNRLKLHLVGSIVILLLMMMQTVLKVFSTWFWKGYYFVSARTRKANCTKEAAD